MAIKIGPIDKWFSSGAKAFNTTLAAVAASDQSSSYPGTFHSGRLGVVRLTLATTHGYAASPDLHGKPPNLLYIQGVDTFSYIGQRIVVAASATIIDIVAKYVEETPTTNDLIFPGFKFDHDVEFVGFDLHLTVVSGTTENLVVSSDADRGTAWDIKHYSKDMNGVKDIVRRFADSGGTLIIPANTIVKFTWANTNSKTWGLTVYTKRLV